MTSFFFCKCKDVVILSTIIKKPRKLIPSVYIHITVMFRQCCLTFHTLHEDVGLIEFSILCATLNDVQNPDYAAAIELRVQLYMFIHVNKFTQQPTAYSTNTQTLRTLRKSLRETNRLLVTRWQYIFLWRHLITVLHLGWRNMYRLCNSGCSRTKM